MKGIRAALADAGRDPVSLDLTVGINVVLPELSEQPLEVGGVR